MIVTCKAWYCLIPGVTPMASVKGKWPIDEIV